jgi:hypothetical protein
MIPRPAVAVLDAGTETGKERKVKITEKTEKNPHSVPVRKM